MEKALRPDKLRLDPKLSADGTNRAAYTYWKATIDQYLVALQTNAATALTDAESRKVLISLITPDIYTMIENIPTYAGAITQLESVFIRTSNTVHARYLLATRRQQEGETVKQYHLVLQNIAKECDFKAVTAPQHIQESIRTAFISGLRSDEIRKRLLETTSSLSDSLTTADAIEEASRNAKLYTDTYSPTHINAIIPESSEKSVLAATRSASGWKCYYCGGMNQHSRKSCPAFNSQCDNCTKKGHWASVCRGEKGRSRPRVSAITGATHLANPALSTHPTAFIPAASISAPNGGYYEGQRDPSYYSPYLASVTPAFPSSLSNAVINVKVNRIIPACALLDTGSSLSFISKKFSDETNLPAEPCSSVVTMATESHSSQVLGVCQVTLEAGMQNFGTVKLLVLEHLCSDIIIGHDIMEKHDHIRIWFNGHKPPIEVSARPYSAAVPVLAKIQPKSLFANLTSDVRPIACSSRKFSPKAAKFIAKTVEELHAGNIIRPSSSPWRAQVLVTGLDEPKPRMVVDYSRTINKFTLLDAFPLPSIESTVARVAQYSLYSTYDLKSAYYQVPILESEKQYTAFEAAANLWEFNVVPFGATNGVPVFQRTMAEIVDREELDATITYVDNVTVCGDSQAELDNNVARWLQACSKYGLTLNKDKTVSSVKSLCILGYCVSKGSIKPDPERMKPLLELPVPVDPASLQRAMGLFSYYARWVEKFSHRVHPLVGSPSFPLSAEGVAAFEDVKLQIAKSCIVCPNETEQLVLESDASDFALSASLSQGGKPVAFFSRTLKPSERKHHAMEKEACAIIESCRKWNHYLVGRKFRIVTDQQAVSFMFDQKHNGKVKNDKILRWRIELSTLDFDIQYRPGPLNVTADCLSRATCASATRPVRKSLAQIHEDLCHPGIVRLNHFVRTKNLPYSLEQVKTVCNQCRVCAAIKPQFFRPDNPPLIEATKPFDRISVDFKGPLPSVSSKKYLFVAVDEYSRYVWAFPCVNMETDTVKRCLVDIFAVAGNPGFIHSDRGPSLISKELHSWLISNGIGYSNSAKYNPRGNGQVERYNGVIWKGVQLALRTKGLSDAYYEQVLQEVLHSQRSLLCTATNSTPHERLFRFERRSASGASLPSWLLEKGPVLVRNHARKSKYMPIVTEVELVEANPSFAKIRYPSGREDNVSLRDLAPIPRETHSPRDDIPDSNEVPPPGTVVRDGLSDRVPGEAVVLVQPDLTGPTLTDALVPNLTELDPPVLRRSTRISKIPDRYVAE